MAAKLRAAFTRRIETVVRVLIATHPVRFRKGMDGLAVPGPREAWPGPVFRRGARVSEQHAPIASKLLFWDGSGLTLMSKRLEQGGFKRPPSMQQL
jgi:transposase